MKLSAIVAFISREVKRSFRDKAVVFWVIAWPIIWILMVAYVFVPPGATSPVTLKVGVVNLDNSSTPFNGTSLVEVMNTTEYHGAKLFSVKLYTSIVLLERDLRQGKLDAGIVIPERFGENVTLGQARILVMLGARDPYTSSISYGVLSVFLYEINKRIGYTKADIALKYMEEFMEEKPWSLANWSIPWLGNKSFIEFLRIFYKGLIEPINASFREVKPEAMETRPRIIGWYTIGAIGMMFLYSGFSIGAGIVVSETRRDTLRRILAAPVTEAELLLGKTLGGLSVLIASAVIALVFGVLVAGAEITWNPLNPAHWLALAMMIVAAFMSVGIGILLSLAAKTAEGASSLATALGLMLAFTAGIWFPREWMPPPLRILADYFPVTWALDSVRATIVYERPLASIYWNVIGSLVALIAIYVLGIIVYNKSLRRHLERA